MPFSRRRIKVISDGATGRNRTRYVRPTVAEERQRPMEDNDGDAGLGNAADGTGGLSPDPTNLNLPTEEGDMHYFLSIGAKLLRNFQRQCFLHWRSAVE